MSGLDKTLLDLDLLPINTPIGSDDIFYAVINGHDYAVPFARIANAALTEHGLVSDKHTASGLTTGHFLRATSATAFEFGALTKQDVTGVLSDWFELVGDAPNQYIRCKYPFAGDYEISSWTNTGWLPPNIWEAMPIASAAVLGGVKIGTGIFRAEDGTISVTTGAGMVYPAAGIPISTGSAWGSSITPTNGYLKYNSGNYSWESIVSSQWITSGLNVYYNSGNVYIGQATGTYTLDVNGTFRATGIARLGYTSRIIGSNTIANTFTSALYFRDSADAGYGEVGRILSSRETVGLYGTTGVGIDFFTNGSITPKMYIDTSGRVGVGTTTLMDYKVNIVGTTDNYMQVIATNVDTKAGYILGNDARNYVLRIDGADGDKFQIRDITANAQRLTLDSSGRFSINTVTNTTDQLLINSVQGNTSNSGLRVIYQDATTVLGEAAFLAHRNGVWSNLYLSGSGSSNNYGIYVDGTKPNYFAGGILINVTGTTTYALHIKQRVDSAEGAYMQFAATGSSYRMYIKNDITYLTRGGVDTYGIQITNDGKVGIKRAVGTYALEVEGDIYGNGWLRTSGAVGWFNQSYGGGIYMTDSTYVRVYNSKKFFVNNDIETTGSFVISVGGAAKWKIKINASNELEFYNASDIMKLILDQNGNLAAKGEVAAYA